MGALAFYPLQDHPAQPLTACALPWASPGHLLGPLPRGPPPQGPSRRTHPCLQTEAPTLDTAGLSAAGAQWGNPDTEGGRTPPPAGHLAAPLDTHPLFPRTLGALGRMLWEQTSSLTSSVTQRALPTTGHKASFSQSFLPACQASCHTWQSVTSGPVFTASQVPLEGGLCPASGPPGPQPCFWLRMELMG